MLKTYKKTWTDKVKCEAERNIKEVACWKDLMYNFGQLLWSHIKQPCQRVIKHTLFVVIVAAAPDIVAGVVVIVWSFVYMFV